MKCNTLEVHGDKKGINGAVLRSRKDYKNVAKHGLEFTAFDNYQVQGAETISSAVSLLNQAQCKDFTRKDL